MNPQEYHFTLPDFPDPPTLKLPEIWYPGVKQYWDQCTSSRIWDAILGVRAIVIHATAGASSAGAISVMRAGRASFHWLIPDENEPEHGEIIWACAPEARAAWHVRNDKFHPDVNEGKNKINHWSLGVELVNTQQGDPFSDWQIKMAADIVKYAWAKYPNLKHVVSHAKLDPSRRTDPGIDFPWERFRAQVLVDNFDDMVACQEITDARAEVLASTELPQVEGDICC